MFKEYAKQFFHSVLNSYSQIFFSADKLFAGLLLLASFLDPYCGFSGLLSVLIAVHAAKILGLNQASITSGLYSFNALLSGLMMGYYFSFSPVFLLMLFFVSLINLFLSVWFESRFSANGLPFLSLPFMFSVWIIILGSRSFGAIVLNERGIFTFNELWSIGGENLVYFYERINSADIPLAISVYLKSLGAIFFQSNVISGFLIAAGLLLFSRIAFTLSLLGFFTGYLFYYFIDADFHDILYSYIGFNFILSAIAIGGFFIIPSAYSYLLVIIITPLTGILSSALGNILQNFQLPVFSLPFNIIVLLTLALLKSRISIAKPELVLSQQFSPEKNLYKHKNRLERFKNETYFHIHLPFFSEWTVSQGHNGKHTHQEAWCHAWDFVVGDETGKTFRPPGERAEDFFCYNLPILAPGAGYIINIIDEIDDNPIGGVDIAHNWGNALVIKHNEYLYSNISHIKKNSFKVKIGDYVKKGDMLATCGNSGRSPAPHIHFQLQAAPFVGSKTLKYPVSYYISKNKTASKEFSSAMDEQSSFSFHAFDYPVEGQNIMRPTITGLLREAFNFIPGSVFKFQVTRQGSAIAEPVRWEVFVDAYNHPYLYCHNTKSFAYFVNNETLHYFTEFSGDKNSLLYLFYIGTHKILLGYYHRMQVTDKLPIEGFYSGWIKLLQDFAAPFHIFLKAEYSSFFSDIDDASNPASIEIKTKASVRAGDIIRKNAEFVLSVKENKIKSFVYLEKGKIIKAEAV